VEKHHALIESAAQLDPATSGQLVDNLKAKYGADLTTDFRVTPSFLAESASRSAVTSLTVPCANA